MTSANGWTLLFHPEILAQLKKLTAAVVKERVKKPDTYQQSANAKLLAAIDQLINVTVPSDPTRSEYRQGDTLGKEYKHWFRAKFGNGRFRLFFRFDSKAKVVIFAWVNDENTLRTYGKNTDAYATFRKMLEKGSPPDTWRQLLEESRPSPAPKISEPR